MSKLPTPNKSLGQHFLKDKNVIAKITQDFAKECDVIVEIGPGPAVLTKELVKHNKETYVIEKDPRMLQHLSPIIKKENIYIQDALDFNWQGFIEKHNLQSKKIWLVSNLPYNVSAPLFMSFLPIPSIHFMTLMFQKEVGEKTLLRPENNNSMNSLCAISNTFFLTKLLIKVAPGAFLPPPQVDSIVISYKRLITPLVSLDQFDNYEKFIRTLFALKRKTISNVLKQAYPSEKIKELFHQVNILPTTRSETLSITKVVECFEHLIQN